MADWVYEEEVLSASSALWWSPDSNRLAYLVTNDDGIRDFEYSIFNSANNAHNVQPYSETKKIPYPKPGTPNPVVSVEVFDLGQYKSLNPGGPSVDAVEAQFIREMTWNDRRDKAESIIQEVAWVGPAELMVKEVNRGANDGVTVYLDLRGTTSISSHVARRLGKDGEEGDDGWIEPGQNIYWLRTRTGQSAYLDVLPNAEGYMHIALFDPADSGKPQWLTSGAWEVVNGIASVDEQRGVVYFMAAYPTAFERHVFSVTLPQPGVAPVPPAEPHAISDISHPSYYGVSFSPQSGYYLLAYQGPQVPRQSIFKVDNSSTSRVPEAGFDADNLV